MELFSIEDQRTGLKGLQFESLKIKHGTRRWVGVQIDLKSAIEQKAAHLVGSDPTAHAVTCFQDNNRAACFMQIHRTCQTR